MKIDCATTNSEKDKCSRDTWIEKGKWLGDATVIEIFPRARVTLKCYLFSHHEYSNFSYKQRMIFENDFEFQFIKMKTLGIILNSFKFTLKLPPVKLIVNITISSNFVTSPTHTIKEGWRVRFRKVHIPFLSRGCLF